MKAKQVLVAILLASACVVRAATNDLTALLQKGLFEEEANHNLEAAMQAYQTAITEHDKDRKLVATAIFRLGECLRKQGKTNEAAAQYQRVLREFSEQETLVKMSVANVGGQPQMQAGSNYNRNEQSPELKALQSVYQENAPKAMAARALAERVSKLNDKDLVSFFTTIRPDATLIRLIDTRDAAEALAAKAAGLWGTDHSDRKLAEAEAKQSKAKVSERVAELQWAIKNDVETLSLQEAELRDRIAKETTKTAQTAQPHAETVSASSENDEDKEIRAIKSMIQNSPDLINAGDGGNETPLKKAARKGQLRIAEFLLQNGADIEATGGKKGETPLAVAASGGQKAMVELLLSKNANPNGEGDDKPADTPLHRAVRNEFRSVVQVLIANKANVNCRNASQERPLHLAARNGNKAITEMLVAAGANIDPKDSEGLTPLFFAVRDQHLDVAELLISRKADLNVTSRNHITPLHLAVSAGSTQLVKLLLDNGANVGANSTDTLEMGPTPLTWAIARQNGDIVKLLLEYHADPNIKFSWKLDLNAVWNQCTPLVMAIKQFVNEPGIVESLLANGADPNARGYESDYFPLFRAIQYRNNSALRYLIQYKANLNVIAANTTAYTVAVVWNNYEAVEMLSDAGADINLNENQQDTALHEAVNHSDPKMVSLLISRKANVNALNGRGQPPLAYTKADNQSTERKPVLEELANLLIHAGADINYERKGQISVRAANAAKPTPIFFKGTNAINQHTLAELIADTYSIKRVLFGFDSFGVAQFPDFSDLSVERLQPDGTIKSIRVDAAALLETGDASKDIALMWGDIVVIQELDHPVGARWLQMPHDQFTNLCGHLSRTVEVTVKGQKNAIILLPRLAAIGSASPMAIPTYGSFLNSYRRDHTNTVVVGFKLAGVMEDSGLLRVSSDVTRVKVTHHNADGTVTEMVCNETPNASGSIYDYWLRDGDVVEIPERDPNAPPAVNANGQPANSPMFPTPGPLPSPLPAAPRALPGGIPRQPTPVR